MILLTGITGNVGGAVATALLEKNIRFRALVLESDMGTTWADKGVELVCGDLNDPVSVTNALEDIERAVLVMPNGQDQERLELSYIESARQVGLPWILKLSSPEAVQGTTSPIPLTHIAAEDAIRESGMNWTFVRPSFFMHNFRGSIPQAKVTGKLSMPMGNGKVVLTDCADAGRFIARLLTDKNPARHYGQCYDITGPDDAMTFAEIATMIGNAIGREVAYDDCDPKAYQEAIRPYMSGDWHSDAIAVLFAEIADGTTPATSTDTFKKVMGYPATSFEEYLQALV